MANKRANPLSGYFKSPPTAEKSKEAAKAEMEAEAGILGSTGEEQKPPEQTKDGKEQKAPAANGPAKPGEEQKPPEQAKDGKEQKAPAADGPAKPGEEQKPPEPTKDGKEQKAPTDGPTKPGEEQKPPEPTKDGKEQKVSADGPAKPGEEQKPPEPEKDPKLRFVKLSDIKPLSGTYVKDTPRSDYSDLIASIKEHGLEQPIILRQGEKGDYQLVHGFHRCEALKQAGMLEIRADVYAMKLSEASDYRRNRDKNPPIPGTLILPFPTQQPEKAVDGEKGEKPPLAAEAPSAPGTGEPEANRTAEGPKGSTVTHIFDDRLDAPGDSEMHSLPIPKEGEVYSLALHPAYFRDFLDHPFTVNRETQDYQELFESIKTYGIREPIKCRPGRDGGVEIISGHRRHDIGMQLNFPYPHTACQTLLDQIFLFLQVRLNSFSHACSPRSRFCCFAVCLIGSISKCPKARAESAADGETDRQTGGKGRRENRRRHGKAGGAGRGLCETASRGGADRAGLRGACPLPPVLRVLPYLFGERRRWRGGGHHLPRPGWGYAGGGEAAYCSLEAELQNSSIQFR